MFLPDNLTTPLREKVGSKAFNELVSLSENFDMFLSDKYCCSSSLNEAKAHLWVLLTGEFADPNNVKYFLNGVFEALKHLDTYMKGLNESLSKIQNSRDNLREFLKDFESDN